ncbi:hypothetical protein NDU88_000109 [Pleurodeles waltl]|uniref:Uncharacterized protein n=1 Tax=Pleurodeles waltl TaxID=8319 RepID=A0AAV7V833_PLEWA|nr:hypothetical protein NDU88_000109 [Pleurodeles waltl]
MLWNYRTTPHSTTQETPFVLLKGRKPCTKAVPGWMGKAGKKRVSVRNLAFRVEEAQEKYDESILGKPKECVVAVGDWVRTRVWHGGRKGLSKWSEPKMVGGVKCYTVVLSNGKRWNMADVVRCSEMEVAEWKKQVGCGRGVEESRGVRRSQRVFKKPEYMKDYYTE